MASVSNDTWPAEGGNTIYDSPGPREGGGDINNDMTITILHNNRGTIHTSPLNTIINYSNVNSYRAKINDDQRVGGIIQIHD